MDKNENTPAVIPCYRIKWWDEIYETNRTREIKKMKWLALPIKLHGDGYSMIMEDKKRGAAIFGAWVACVEVAALCDPRGTLVRSTGEPHDASSIGRICRIPSSTILLMLEVVYLKCKWIEIIDLKTNKIMSHNGAGFPHNSAGFPHLGADTVLLCNVMSSSTNLIKNKTPIIIGQKNWKEGKRQHLDNVWLKETEYQALEKRCGKSFLTRCIEKLDAMIEDSPTGKKYTNHAAAIRRWVIPAVEKEGLKRDPIVTYQKPIISPSTPEEDAAAIELFQKTLPPALKKNIGRTDIAA